MNLKNFRKNDQNGLVETSEEAILPKRDISFDNVRGLLIILVVVGHYLNLERYPSICGRFLYILIYFFHMAAFIFISGFFSKNLDKNRKNAVNKYLIPYFLLLFISYIQIYLLNVEPTFVIRIFTPPNGCWFLFVLFIYKYLMKDLLRIRFVLPVAIVVGLGSGFSEEFTQKLCLSRAFVFLAFFMIGYYTTKEHIAKIRRLPKIISVVSILLLTTVSLYFATQEKFSIASLYVKSFYRDDAVLYDLGVRCLFYLFGMLMIVACIQFAYPKQCFLTKIGKNSESVYFIHLLLARFLDSFLEKYQVVFPSKYLYIAVMVVLAVITSYLLSRDVVYKGLQRFIGWFEKLCLKPLEGRTHA